jgi:hypothetical protein
MKQFPEPLIEPPRAESESDFDYDPAADPLRVVVNGILHEAKTKKFRRVKNPRTMLFEKPKEAEPTGDPYQDAEIARIKYPGGLGHPQKGHFSVGAIFLDASGHDIGGGWVESFEDRLGAERCAYIIRRINPAHEPTIHRQE